MQAQTATNKFLLAAAPLFLVLFIDSMGLGLVFPLLNALLMSPTSSILSPDTSADARNLIFGLTIGSFMLCWFFGAAFMGDLSDQVGRKKALMVCLVGSFLGYALSAVGVIFTSLTLVILGRVLAGFTAGSQAIAQAAIVDLSVPEHKARNIGLILFAMSLGFIVGPLLGGFLSDHNLVSWFDFSTPFYFAAAISLLNAILLWVLFSESFTTPAGKLSIKVHRAIAVFISAFRDEKVKKLSYILLIMILGWSSFYSFISMFLLRRYDFSPVHIGIFMGVMGLGFGIGTGLFVDYLTKRYELKKIVVVSLLIGALSALVIVLSPQPIYAWIAIGPLAAAIAIAYSVILTIFSNQVSAERQGWIMGITGSIMAFAFGISAIVVGMLADLGPRVPILVTVIGLGLSAIMMRATYKPIKTI